MYNNEVTYDFRWNSKENIEYEQRLYNKYLHRAQCSSDCPRAWAKEVWELMEYLDKEFGIAQNTETINGFWIRSGLIRYITIDTVKTLFKQINNVYIKPSFSKNEKDIHAAYYKGYSFSEKFNLVLKQSIIHRFSYFFSSCRAMFVNPIINKIRKPKIVLSQVKEKFGELQVYYVAPDYLRDHLDLKIRETEMKLAKKGAYYPPECYYFASTTFSVDNPMHPNSYEVRSETLSDGRNLTTLKVFCFREAMQNVGLDLDEMKLKAEERKARHQDETI